MSENTIQPQMTVNVIAFINTLSVNALQNCKDALRVAYQEGDSSDVQQEIVKVGTALEAILTLLDNLKVK